MSEWNDVNRQVIDEFRSNEGRVGGQFEGAPMILVNRRGAKSGNAYTSPLVYTRDDANYVVIAPRRVRRTTRSGSATSSPVPM